MTTTSRKLNVLVIDDSETDSFFIQEELSSSEWINDLQFSKNPVEAFHQLCESRRDDTLPDLILLDESMPFLCGFELIEELEEANISEGHFPFKIFMITHSMMMRDREKFEREVHIQEFISKPLNKLEIEALIRKHFQNESVHVKVENLFPKDIPFL